MRQHHWILLLILLSGCATLGIMEYDKHYGISQVENRLSVKNITAEQGVHYNKIIKPIIENRCVVCHGCFDAPCQLKMENQTGLERGANKTSVYNGERLLTAKQNYSLSTLTSFDKNQLQSLRQDGFFSILNERQQTPIANANAGLMYQMLQLKQQHPLPDTPLLDDNFDISLNRSQQCPTIEEFDQYKNDQPLGGMPYALPALNATQHQQLSTWLKDGAKFPKSTPATVKELTIIEQWETWLNNTDNKQQLVSRYLFEHLYLANLYFESGSSHYFKLVRSSTPPGSGVAIINTRRPFDAPFTDNQNATKSIPQQVYYRLLKNNDTIIAKRHMPYQFGLKKLKYLNELFITPTYQVKQLPSYRLKEASNPFITFEALPTKSRYRFLLEQAQFSIMNFIKGPVCRGQLALNVIEDHFWVFFAEPSYIDNYHSDSFIDENSDLLQLPAATSDKALSLLYWRSYAKKEKEYIKNKLSYMEKIDFRQSDLDLDLIWSGDDNPNATLTIFRHFDSASVLQGFIGQTPKTAWFITYPLLERIHYLLVAGFDVYGNVGHQLKTRLYMDFLRMEAESNFIALLPKKDRKREHEHWYRNTDKTIKDYIFSDEFYQLPQSNITYKTPNAKKELLQQIAKHTNNNLVSTNYNLTNNKSHNINDYKLMRLNNITGKAVAILPQVSYLVVNTTHGDLVYSLINNSAHTNVAHLFSENDRRIPEEDNLTILAGIVGTYPNAFFQINEQQVGEFISALEQVQTEQDYGQLKDKFAIRRTNPNFWRYADKLHNWYRKNQPDSAGLLDFNRLENR